MANPILNDKALDQAAERAGWGKAASQAGPASQTANGPVWNPPVSDGPVTPWPAAREPMTVAGTATATGVLLVLLLVAAFFGWNAVTENSDGQVAFPGIALIGVLVGFVAVIVSSIKPNLARFLAPVYALAEGFFLGAISKTYNSIDRYQGVVVQAVGATLAVFAVMLFLYRTKVIKVTDRFRRTVIGATLGLMLFYGISMLIQLFTHKVPFFQNSSGIGILFSLFAAGLAAMNLAIDFDFIERASASRQPKQLEWFAAMGLLVTLVWLYLELLRLLSKLRDR